MGPETGGGPLSDYFKQPPPDLATIARRRGGEFPTFELYEIIDGRRGLRGHGGSQMPVWGDAYRVDVESELFEKNVPHVLNPEFSVHARILSLVYYLESIRAKILAPGGRASVDRRTGEATPMKALLINPEARSIEAVEVGGLDDIVRLIGHETVISDEIGPEGDRLFFDEECFLRGTQGRFQVDSVVPVSGIGVVVGASGADSSLRDVVSDARSLEQRLKYL